MRLVVTAHEMTFLGTVYRKGDVIPASVVVTQRQIEPLVATRRVRVELDESELQDDQGRPRCSVCGRALQSIGQLDRHLAAAHDGERRVRPVTTLPQAPSHTQPQKQPKARRAAA